MDTQVVFWSSFEPDAITARAVEALVAGRNSKTGLCIAASTLWEISMMVSRGKVLIPHSLNTYLRQITKRFQVLPITIDIAEKSISFSDAFPKDPADRLIGATALVHGLPLITADKLIRASGEVPCIW